MSCRRYDGYLRSRMIRPNDMRAAWVFMDSTILSLDFYFRVSGEKEACGRTLPIVYCLRCTRRSMHVVQSGVSDIPHRS